MIPSQPPRADAAGAIVSLGEAARALLAATLAASAMAIATIGDPSTMSEDEALVALERARAREASFWDRWHRSRWHDRHELSAVLAYDWPDHPEGRADRVRRLAGAMVATAHTPH